MIKELAAKLDIIDKRYNFLQLEGCTQKAHVLLDPRHVIKLLWNVFSTAETEIWPVGKVVVRGGAPQASGEEWL